MSNVRRRVFSLVVPVVIAAASAAALADTVGWIVIGGGAANPTAVITGQGHTAVALSDLTAGSIAGLDVVWVFNSSPFSYSATLTTQLTALTNYVNAGGFLLFHDRLVTGAGAVIPGMSGVTTTQSLSNAIDVLNSGTVVTNGPGGTITNTTLDNRNFSNHGFATSATLPVGATAILGTSTAGQVVDFTYGLGSGAVYYSTIPLDFFVGGASVMRTIYAPNVLTFATNFVAAPEPSSLALFGLGGLGLVGIARRRRAAAKRASAAGSR